MIKRIFFIAQKEFIQLLRDRRTLGLVLIAPIIQLIVFGYVATTEIRKSRMVVCDYSRTPKSRDFMERFRSSGYFEIYDYVTDEKKINRYLDRGKAVVGVVIPPDFATNLSAGKDSDIGIYIDGTNSNLAMIISGYLRLITARYSNEVSLDFIRGLGVDPPNPIDSWPRVWFNQELKSANFMVPGVMAMLTLILLLNLTALAIVRERESGTAEQISVTPIKPLELIIGKIIPPVLIGYLVITLVMVVGMAWFKIGFAGSVLLLYFFSLFFIVACLAAGLMISTFSHTADQAMWTNQIFTMPNILLSGFIFPISNMPKPIQAVTYLLPMRYFLKIIRGIFMRGSGFEQHWDEALILLLWGVVVISLASLRLKKRLV